MKPLHQRNREVQSLDLNQIVGMKLLLRKGNKPFKYEGTILPMGNGELGIWASFGHGKPEFFGKIVDYEIDNYRLLDWSINIQKRLNKFVQLWNQIGNPKHLKEAHKLVWRAAFLPNAGLRFVITVTQGKFCTLHNGHITSQVILLKPLRLDSDWHKSQYGLADKVAKDIQKNVPFIRPILVNSREYLIWANRNPKWQKF